MNPKNRCICPAAQLYTVRDFTKTPEAIGTTLRKIKAIGFQAIQISGFGPIERAASPRWWRSSSLTCASHTAHGSGCAMIWTP